MVNITSSRGTGMGKRPADSLAEGATDTRQEWSGRPVIVDERRDESLNADVLISMFAGQIHDALASDEGAWPEYPRAGEDTYVNNGREAARVLNPFCSTAPAAYCRDRVTAKKQGRRMGEKLEAVPSNLDPGRPDLGVKFVDSKFGDSNWILQGSVVEDWFDEDGVPEPEPEAKAELEMLSIPRRITCLRNNKTFSLRTLAAVALANNNPWAFIWTEKNLFVCRFYKIHPGDRYLPAVHPGQVRVGVSYFTVPMLTDKAADPSASTAWQHKALFQLPWHWDAPLDKRPYLSQHLSLWVALMARLCSLDEPNGMGTSKSLNSWYRDRKPFLKDEVHESHYSTAFKKTMVVHQHDKRPYSVILGMKKPDPRHVNLGPDAPDPENEEWPKLFDAL